jgi:acyl-coenzyme A thioesterase PaaI-like protein
VKVVPRVGMAARVVHLGTEEQTVIAEVHDGGRVLVAAGQTFVLHPMTGRFVREGDPYYGVRLVLDA